MVFCILAVRQWAIASDTFALREQPDACAVNQPEDPAESAGPHPSEYKGWFCVRAFSAAGGGTYHRLIWTDSRLARRFAPATLIPMAHSDVKSQTSFSAVLKAVLPTVLGVFAVLYLIFHVLQGDRGLLSWPERERALDAAKSELIRLETIHATLENKVSLLRREGLDIDMLEERARVMLNFTRDDEVVILFTE